jgi:hypothetical protein
MTKKPYPLIFADKIRYGQGANILKDIRGENK